MIFCACLVVFFYTVGTGHACDGMRERRQKLLDWPAAKIHPIKACRRCHRIACPWHL